MPTGQSVNLNPLGFVQTSHSRKWELPRQPGLHYNTALIDCTGLLAREALEDLAGFERIWIIFSFHQAGKAKSKVRPPRGNKKRGVLATRTPHHPNAVGLSCVELTSIVDFKITISNHDLLDGTPVLDIKPYIPYCDSFPTSKAGWIDELPKEIIYPLHLTELIKKQLSWLADNDEHIYEQIEGLLSRRPYPYPNHRIKALGENTFCLSLRDWRIYYGIEKEVVLLTHIGSGYVVDGTIPEIHRIFSDIFRYIGTNA